MIGQPLQRLRAAIAAVDPAELTHLDRLALLDLFERSMNAQRESSAAVEGAVTPR